MKFNLATVFALAALSTLVTLAGCGDSGSSKSTPATDGGISGAGVTVSDPNARGCEVLLLEGGARVDSVTFDDTVKGTFIREAPRVAVSFVAAGDAPIAAGAVQVSLSGGAGDVEVKTVHCVDAQAKPLADVSVTLK